MSSSQDGKNVNKPTAVGMGVNNAKIREALVLIANTADCLEASLRRDNAWDGHIQDAGNIRNIARDALATPPRNCDVASEEEAVESFRRTIPTKGLSDDEREIVKVCINDIIRTLYAPYQEGDVK